MFGISDLLALVISAFIILPVVMFIRELGYFTVSMLFGVKNPRFTIGSGPRLIKFWILDIRKYYHVYSWFSFDDVKRKSNFTYIIIYAAPIVTNIIVALTLNSLLANGFLQEQARFWNRFIFYVFFYVLFDSIPMLTTHGKPNNGMIIYELIRYGKRVDYNDDDIIPSTTQVDEDYDQEMKKVEKMQEKIEQLKSGKLEKEDRSTPEKQVMGERIQEDLKDTAEDIAKEELEIELEKNPKRKDPD
ncbi:site-2 protease family protein [Sporosarcina gallistercoris]|uniref:site-2 protease family protein n=1 Tax=Sporosarcina gallistercoris TaxID=2762245 RepID=UPI003D2CEAB0